MNNLKQFHDLLHDKEINDIRKTDGVTYFHFEIARNILKAFLCYPTLESISFNLEEIDRIANVWEGSDEETVFFDSSKWNDENQLLPKFFNVNDSLTRNYEIVDYHNLKNNKDIILINQENHHEELSSLFYFLTEEPSFPRKIVKEYKQSGLDLEYNFNYNFNNENSSQQLEEQLLKFLGPKNNALLMNIFLNTENNTKIKKAKI